MANPKIITVSGLYSGVGKTQLCEHIIALLPGTAAIKVTINDYATEVLGDEASIMVAGKDTWRLKTAGASAVIWVRAQEEKLAAALAQARQQTKAAEHVLVEGNSVLAHLQPDLALFVCDERLCGDAPLKPSRSLALSRAHAVIINLRSAGTADPAAITARVRQLNPAAAIHALDLADAELVPPLLRAVLEKNGLLSS